MWYILNKEGESNNGMRDKIGDGGITETQRIIVEYSRELWERDL